MFNIKKIKLKNSTQIALGATVVWIGYTRLAGVNRSDGIIARDKSGPVLIIGLVVIWDLKFIFGTFADKQGDK